MPGSQARGTVASKSHIRALLTASLFLTACRCNSPAPVLSIDSQPSAQPDPLDFGEVPLGQTEVLPLVLTNTGALELLISQVAIAQSDAGAPQFQFTPLTNPRAPFGASIQPGASATANLECTPGAAGVQTAVLAISSNSNGEAVYSVPLRCSGLDVAIAVQPAPLDFGNVQLGVATSLPVTFTNQGSSASDAIVVSPIIGTQAAEFSFSGTPGPLGPGQAFTLNVTFSPKAPGPASALLPYRSCATCQAQELSLAGVGIDGQLTFNPSPVTFGAVPSGTAPSIPLTIENSGTAIVSITALGLDGGGPFSLGGAPTTPITIFPTHTVQVQVVYAPSSQAGDHATLAATWLPLDGSGNPIAGIAPQTATDALIGNESQPPCTLEFAPPGLDFGTVAGSGPIQKMLTLSDVSMAQSCSVSAIALSPGTDPEFSLVAPSTASLAIGSGQSQSIAVQFELANPGAPFARDGALTFATTDPSQPTVSIPLSAFSKSTSPYAAGWPKWHNDNTDQGLSSADTSQNVGLVLWKFPVGVPLSLGGVAGTVNPDPTYMNSPVVDGTGSVYQLGMDGTFYGVSSAGTMLWSTSLLPPNPDPHPSTPIIAADGSIFVESGTDQLGGVLSQVASGSGTILFQAGTPTNWPSCLSSACADGFDVPPTLGQAGELFEGDDLGWTVTYSVSSNSLTQGASELLLPFGAERVAVALDSSDDSFWCSQLFCFGVTPPSSGFQQMAAWPATGALNQTSSGATSFDYANSDLALDAQHTGWLMVETGTIQGNTGQTVLAALDPLDGSVHWQFRMPTFTTPSPFDPLSGQGTFNSDVGNSAPAIGADGTVYVGNGDGLYAFDGPTGSLKPSFPFKTPSDVDSAAAIGGDGTIFFGSADGTFYAIAPSGALKFKVVTGGRISSSPAIGPDGTVFVVSDDGNLYAIR